MEQLRPAGPNERRCIVRQALGYYRSLIVGGLYSVDGDVSALSFREAIFGALKHCVSIHPILSAAIAQEDTEAPTFVRPPTLDLNNHVVFLCAQQLSNNGSHVEEQSLIRLALMRTHDQPFEARDKIPPWKITILRIDHREDEESIGKDRFLVLFAYYHSHGDGKSGLAFHKTFLKGLALASNNDFADATTEQDTRDLLPLLPTVEQAGRLSVSWFYLLSPLLGAYLPKFISEPLNLRASVTPAAPDQWRGNQTSHDPNAFNSGVELLVIDNEVMRKVLSACRTRGSKFTGLLHQLIVGALSEALPVDTPAGSFVAGTAVDLRKLVEDFSDDDMALCVTVHEELFKRTDSNHWTEWTSSSSNDHPVWTAARAITTSLAKTGSTLCNQPIGLLGYLNNMYTWTRGQLGKPRSTSYEISNLLSFNPGSSQVGDPWQIERMFFSQPANAVGGCVSFNTVSRDGGDFTLIMNWQRGALGLDNEEEFAARVCDSIRQSLNQLADA